MQFEMQGGGFPGMGGGGGEPVEAEPEHELDCAAEYKWIAGSTWNWVCLSHAAPAKVDKPRHVLVGLAG